MKLNDLIIDITNDKYTSGDLFNIAELHKTIAYNVSQIEITGLGGSPMALSLLSETENLIKDYRNSIIINENEIETYFYKLDRFPDQTNNDEYNILSNHLCAAKILSEFLLKLFIFIKNFYFITIYII